MNSIQKANKFLPYAKNFYSQFGEDGIIEEIFKNISKNNWCVEFGAWDGMHLSNTYNLIANHNYKSVLIEADAERFEVLKKNMRGFDTTLINEYVMFSGKNTLDKILTRTPIPKDFDFLSIDIDGCDFYIFESLELYRPKIICIEYNPTIPNEVIYVQPKDFNVNRGASAQAILNLAKSKGYVLAATTKCNLVLVDKAHSAALNLISSNLSDFRNDDEYKVYAFVGYDGKVCLSKPLELPWHGIEVSEDQFQGLPKVIRKFRANYNIFHQVFFAVWKKLKFSKKVASE